MRLYFAIIFIALSSATGFGQSAELSIDRAVFKFPKAYEGDELIHDYKITNSGDAPLIISDYQVSCPCTKAHLPSKPILPGETISLRVTFDTKGKYYFQDRTIQLTANTQKKMHTLRFKVQVIPRNE